MSHCHSHPEKLLRGLQNIGHSAEITASPNCCPKTVDCYGNVESGFCKILTQVLFPLPLLMRVNCFYLLTFFQISLSPFFWQHPNIILKLAGKKVWRLQLLVSNSCDTRESKEGKSMCTKGHRKHVAQRALKINGEGKNSSITSTGITGCPFKKLKLNSCLTPYTRVNLNR